MTISHSTQATSSALESVRNQCTSKRLRISEFFRDHDNLRTGRCSFSAFKSVLSRLNISLLESEVHALASSFSDGDNERFDYRGFLKELTLGTDRSNLSNDSAFKPMRSESSVLSGHKSASWNTGRIPAISLLQAQVYERRVDFRPFFLDFDPLRKGCVSESNLRCVLTQLNFDVTEEEIIELVTLYGSQKPPKTIDYISLCADVERVLQCSSLENDPLGLPPPKFNLLATKEGKKVVLTADELSCAQQVESFIRRRVFQRGINLLGHFRAYDNHGRLVITGNQFARVLSTLGFDVASHEIEILCKRYCMSGSSSRFAYREFCDSIND